MKLVGALVKSLRKILLKIVAGLPTRARFHLIRRLVSLDLAPSRHLTFKLAETKDELEQAFKILHDAYVAEGFMKPDPSGMRITVYHALPTTSTLIAKWKDQVVGTVSIIRKSAFGLPLQKIFDTEKLEKHGGQIVEISSLAIHRDFRGRRGQILFPLCKFLYEYCIEYFVIDYMVIATNPKHADLYEGVMLFEKLGAKTVDEYQFVNGAPAVGFYMDLRKAYNRLLSVYFNTSSKRNLFTYFMLSESFLNFHFPGRIYYRTSDPVMSPEILDYFFSKRTRIFENLPTNEKAIIHSTYSSRRQYLKVLPTMPKNLRFLWAKRDFRFAAQSEGTFHLDQNQEIFHLRTVDVAESGFSAYLQTSVSQGQYITARIRIGKNETVELRAQVAWIADNNMAGFRLISPNVDWHRLILHFKNLLDKMDHNTTTGAWPWWLEKRRKKR